MGAAAWPERKPISRAGGTGRPATRL